MFDTQWGRGEKGGSRFDKAYNAQQLEGVGLRVPNIPFPDVCQVCNHKVLKLERLCGIADSYRLGKRRNRQEN
jgi:hypothetical protein